MKIKRGTTILLVLILIVLNSYLFMKQRNFALLDFSISGAAINKLPSNINNINFSTTFFVLQWIILIAIVIIIYLKTLKHKRKEKAKIEISHLKHHTSRSQTDFDTLHDLLKEKRNLSIGTIATIFGIKKETALDWAKILEENDLATISYPAFSDPEVISKVREQKENKESITDFFSVKQEGDMQKDKKDEIIINDYKEKKEKRVFFGLFSKKKKSLLENDKNKEKTIKKEDKESKDSNKQKDDKNKEIKKDDYKEEKEKKVFFGLFSKKKKNLLKNDTNKEKTIKKEDKENKKSNKEKDDKNEKIKKDDYKEDKKSKKREREKRTKKKKYFPKKKKKKLGAKK